MYEKEANSVADIVVKNAGENSKPAAAAEKARNETPAKSPASAITPVIQTNLCPSANNEVLRKEDEDSLPDSGYLPDILQKKPVFKINAFASPQEINKKGQTGITHSSPLAPRSLENSLSASKGAGAPLPAAMRTDMESAFGNDFSQVRIHDNSYAVQMSKDLHAQAFTHGNDIYFNAGRYNDSSEGKHLLAHEITHVIQQNGQSPLQKKTSDETSPAKTQLSVQGRLNTMVQRDGAEERPTFEYFNLSGVLESKQNMERRFNDLSDYAGESLNVGNIARNKLLRYSAIYNLAYQDYAAAIRAGRQQAQRQNMYLGILIGTAVSVGAAFIAPSAAAGWFALTAAELGTALASGAAQAVVGAGLASTLQFSGGDLEPGGLSPEAQELAVWRTVAQLYLIGARQVGTIRDLHQVVARAEYLVGEIRTQVAGGLPTMTEEQALDSVQRLVVGDQAMARADDAALIRGLDDLHRFRAEIEALNPEGISQMRMEQDIWILWISSLSDSSVLDRDPIEDRLAAVYVLGPRGRSRLGVDFGWWTSSDDEAEAYSAARTEAQAIRQRSLPEPPA